jgi:hypothetical protein
MVNRQMVRQLAATLAVLGFVAGWGSGVADAYTCESVIKAAEERITEAEATLKPDTDARIKARLAEAKGLLEQAKINHRQAPERHIGPVGKYTHGDAVRQARWAEIQAREVIFLATGEPR